MCWIHDKSWFIKINLKKKKFYNKQEPKLWPPWFFFYLQAWFMKPRIYLWFTACRRQEKMNNVQNSYSIPIISKWLKKAGRTYCYLVYIVYMPVRFFCKLLLHASLAISIFYSTASLKQKCLFQLMWAKWSSI